LKNETNSPADRYNRSTKKLGLCRDLFPSDEKTPEAKAITMIFIMVAEPVKKLAGTYLPIKTTHNTARQRMWNIASCAKKGLN
jgi:hypothetical protein